jgi:hypothetical protein
MNKYLICFPNFRSKPFRLQDQRIMEAIYRSAADNRPITLEPIAGPAAFRAPRFADDQALFVH